MNENVVGKNIEEPVIKISLDGLKPYTKDSPYKRICTKCGGIVAIARERQNILKLSRSAYCFLCGQHFDIIDVDKIYKG